MPDDQRREVRSSSSALRIMGVEDDGGIDLISRCADGGCRHRRRWERDGAVDQPEMAGSSAVQAEPPGNAHVLLMLPCKCR